MNSKSRPVITALADVAIANIQIPGATADGIQAQLLNVDGARGIVATVIHISAGSTIPAHFHKCGSEAHYVLEGDLEDNGKSFGPGTYFTHAAGVVHGPHSSVQGCKVLTIQDAQISAGASDFHLAERETSDDQPPTTARSSAGSSNKDGNTIDKPIKEDALPETQKTGPTEDNPTNPKTT